MWHSIGGVLRPRAVPPGEGESAGPARRTTGGREERVLGLCGVSLEEGGGCMCLPCHLLTFSSLMEGHGGDYRDVVIAPPEGGDATLNTIPQDGWMPQMHSMLQVFADVLLQLLRDLPSGTLPPDHRFLSLRKQRRKPENSDHLEYFLQDV